MKIKNKKETFFLVLILLFSFLIRIWKLNQFPSVINGDETGSVIHPLEIILKKLTALFQPLFLFYFLPLIFPFIGNGSKVQNSTRPKSRQLRLKSFKIGKNSKSNI